MVEKLQFLLAEKKPGSFQPGYERLRIINYAKITFDKFIYLVALPRTCSTIGNPNISS